MKRGQHIQDIFPLSEITDPNTATRINEASYQLLKLTQGFPVHSHESGVRKLQINLTVIYKCNSWVISVFFHRKSSLLVPNIPEI